jgi:hypothetical protein
MATKSELEQEITRLRAEVERLQEALVNALQMRPQVVMHSPVPPAPAVPPWTLPLYPGTLVPPVAICDAAGTAPAVASYWLPFSG